MEGQEARGPQREVNTEQAPKSPTRKPTRHNNGEGHASGTREQRASRDSAGVVVAARAQREGAQQGNSAEADRRGVAAPTLNPRGPGATWAEDGWAHSTDETG